MSPLRPAPRPYFVAALLLALAGLVGCDSSALSLGDPNELNAVLDPAFIEPEQEAVLVTLTLNDADLEDVEGDLTKFYVLSADFGQGIGAKNFQFVSNFQLTMTLLRFAEAAAGSRTFTLRFMNHYGEFVAHGALNVY